MFKHKMDNWLKYIDLDQLSIIMIVLINYVSLNVGFFARNYLKGDASYRSFFTYFPWLVLSLNLMMVIDHVMLFTIFWATNNVLLCFMMGLRSRWEAAQASAILTYKTLGFGWLCLVAAVSVLVWQANTFFIHDLLLYPFSADILCVSSILIFISAMTQSALWPFHKWLTSSLNSPTPASAMMHAGLVNGGGFLLAKFFPLFMGNDFILTLVFTIGLITAVIGTLWKLIQSDYKRMLACSTMGQMGFMIVQCGLGLFPAAIAHLCWHGLYKAYMFLGSGTAPQEKRYNLNYPLSVQDLLYALSIGLIGGAVFTAIAYPDIDRMDTRFILISVAVMAGAQTVLPIIRQSYQYRWLMGLGTVIMLSGLYGLSVYGIEVFLGHSIMGYPYDLNVIHIVGLIILMISWLFMLFQKNLDPSSALYKLWMRVYVAALNGGNPQKNTITVNKTHYTDR